MQWLPDVAKSVITKQQWSKRKPFKVGAEEEKAYAEQQTTYKQKVFDLMDSWLFPCMIFISFARKLSSPEHCAGARTL